MTMLALAAVRGVVLVPGLARGPSERAWPMPRGPRGRGRCRGEFAHLEHVHAGEVAPPGADVVKVVRREVPDRAHALP
jgi:hypothetical protein